MTAGVRSGTAARAERRERRRNRRAPGAGRVGRTRIGPVARLARNVETRRAQDDVPREREHRPRRRGVAAEADETPPVRGGQTALLDVHGGGVQTPNGRAAAAAAAGGARAGARGVGGGAGRILEVHRVEAPVPQQRAEPRAQPRGRVRERERRERRPGGVEHRAGRAVQQVHAPADAHRARRAIRMPRRVHHAPRVIRGDVRRAGTRTLRDDESRTGVTNVDDVTTEDTRVPVMGTTRGGQSRTEALREGGGSPFRETREARGRRSSGMRSGRDGRASRNVPPRAS